MSHMSGGGQLLKTHNYSWCPRPDSSKSTFPKEHQLYLTHWFQLFALGLKREPLCLQVWIFYHNCREAILSWKYFVQTMVKIYYYTISIWVILMYCKVQLMYVNRCSVGVLSQHSVWALNVVTALSSYCHGYYCFRDTKPGGKRAFNLPWRHLEHDKSKQTCYHSNLPLSIQVGYQ